VLNDAGGEGGTGAGDGWHDLKAVREPVSRLQISYTIQNPSHRSKPEENLKKSIVKFCENA
jgi:hypothetical protein